MCVCVYVCSGIVWSTTESVLEKGYYIIIMVMGDLPGIDWRSDPPKASHALEILLLEIVTAWKMPQLVLHPTRKSNILDIILATVL